MVPNFYKGSNVPYTRDKNFVKVDKKIYWVQDEIHPLLSHSAHKKNIINKKWLEKPKILCGILIWVYKLAKKNSSHLDIDGVYMLHRGTFAFSSNHDFTHRLSWFLWFIRIPVSYWSQIFFLRLARTTCEGNTKFGIFQRRFATF